MIDKVKSLLIKMLPVSIKDRIKRLIISFKIKYPKVVVFFNGTFTTAELIEEIDRYVDNKTEILMLHTSFNNLKPMCQGSVNEFLDGIIDYSIARNITLVFPGFVLGKNNKSIKKHFLEKKIFNLKKTPTTVGLINEFFRRKEGVQRSSHPSHSLLAYGPKAKQILGSHHLCNSTFGVDTPFHKLEHYNTLIIGLGTYYYRNLTHVHVAEDILGEKFPFPVKPSHEEIPVKLILPEANIEYSLRVFRNEISNKRDLTILKKYISKEVINQYKYKGVPIFVVKPKELTESLISLAKQGITIYR